MASFSKAAIAPSALRSLAKIGFLSQVNPMKILLKRFFKSLRSLDKHSIAMISEAAVMSNPVSRGMPLPVPPKPIVIFLKERSFISITRFQAMVRASRPNPNFLF